MTPNFMNGPFLAHGDTVHFARWNQFLAFCFRVTVIFVKKNLAKSLRAGQLLFLMPQLQLLLLLLQHLRLCDLWACTEPLFSSNNCRLPLSWSSHWLGSRLFCLIKILRQNKAFWYIFLILRNKGTAKFYVARTVNLSLWTDYEFKSRSIPVH